MPNHIIARIILFSAAVLLGAQVSAESVSPKDDVTVTLNDLVNKLQGTGVVIESPVYSGDNTQSGIFSGYSFLFGNKVDEGVVFSTGTASNVVGANTSDSTETDFPGGSVNDPDLGNNLFDVVKLNFDVTPSENTLIVDYVFGSEEYNEYVGSNFNDFIRILINGNNCAVTANGLVVEINSINDRANFPPVNAPAGPSSNSFLYINNDPGLDGVANVNPAETPTTPTHNTQMDGFTKTVSCRFQVTPGVKIPVVIGMADDGDGRYDSWAFFKAQSFRSEPSDEYGDAPDTYQTLALSNGAAHTIVEGVYMGTIPSGDQDGFVDGVDDSAGNAGDDSFDDGVLTFTTLDADILTATPAPYSITVNATSINDKGGRFVGWIDFDGDGIFQTDEASNVATLATNSFETDVTLTWPTVAGAGPDIVFGTTFARIRMVNDDETLLAGDFAGSKASGEVEDYKLQITGVADVTASVVTIDAIPTVTTSIVNAYPVTGTCTAGDLNVNVSISGATPANQSVLCGGGGTWSASFDVSGIADGIGVIVVNATQSDSRGNMGSVGPVLADKDVTPPTLAMQNAPAFANSTSAYTVTFEFSEDVTGFALVDIVVGNGAASNLIAVDGNTYTADITPTGAGDITIDVAANVAQDNNNNNNTAATQVTTVFDNVAPVVSITSAPLANAGNASNYPVSGNCANGDGNVTVSITGATPANQAVACTGGTWSANFDVSGIGDGTNAIVVDASQTDAASNTGNAATVQADKEALVPSVDIQGEPVIVNSVVAFNVTFEFSENVTGFVVGDITVGNGSVNNFIAVDGNTYTADITPSATGDVTIDVAGGVAQDGAANGNTAAIQAVVFFDNVLPVVAITSAPVANAANAANYPVAGSCTTGDGNVTVAIAGATPANQSVLCNAGSWTATFDVSGVTDGTNAISVDASQTDAAGNTGNAVQVQADKDVVAPSVAILSAPIANLANVSSYPVSGSCSTGDGNVAVSIAGVVPAQSVVCNAAAWNATFDVSGLTDGTNAVVVDVSQTDAAGNTGNAVQVQADKDVIAPMVSITGSPDANAANAATYLVSGSCTAGNGDVSVSIAGATPANQNATCTAGGSWSATFDVSGVAEGTNTILVDANQTDAAGNTGNATQAQADHDSTPPGVDIQGEPAAANATPFFVTIQFTEAVSGFALGDITVVNGTASVFNPVDADTYTVTITPDGNGDITIDVPAGVAVDGASNPNNAATQAVVTLDMTAPVVTIDAPVAANIANETSYPVSGTCTPGDGGVNVRINVAGIPTQLSQSPGCTAGGTWSATFDVSIYPDSGNPLNINASQTDVAGNVGAATTEQVVKDTVAPIVPTVNAQSTATQTPVITGTATLAAGESLEVAVNSVTYPEGADLVAAGGNWILTIPIGDALADNTYDVTAVVTDAAGNASTDISSNELTVDTLAPATPVVNALTTNSTTPTITGTAAAVAGETLTVNVDGVTYTDGDSNLSLVAGNWTLNVPAAITPDGTYDVIATLTDAALNSSSDVSNNELVIDTVAPTIPTVTAQTTNNTTPVIAGTADSGTTVTIVVAGATYTTAATAGNTWGIDTAVAVPDSGTFVPDVNGANTVFVTSTDAAGNAASDITIDELTIDTTPPAVPTVNNVNANTATPTITGTATVAAGEVFTVTVNTVTYTEGASDLTLVGSNWTLVIPAGNALADNTYEVLATVTDAATNASSDVSNNELVVDTVAPAVPTVVSQAINSTTPTINGTAVLAAGESLTVTVDGVTYPESGSDLTLLGSNWTLVIPAGNAITPDGTYDVTATITDASTNSTDDATNGELIVDTVILPPTVNAITTSNPTPVITGTAEANSTLTVVVGGATYNNVPVDGTGNWSLDTGVVAPDSGTLLLVEGSNEVVVTATDAAGNSTGDVSSNEITLVLDDDGDGIPNSLECLAGPPFNAANCPDTDGDGTPDFQDTDSDGDGIPDSTEAGNDPDNPLDTDGDGTPDFKDTDSDNDGTDDIDEGTGDSDGDGIPDYVDLPTGNDFDGDGISDDIECPDYTGSGCPDTDSDGLPDYADTDSDGDGIPDANEAGVDPTQPIDTDGDGTPDYQDTDSDNDGTLDSAEAPGDTDGDGIPDVVDRDDAGPGPGDSDGDGIPDNVECVMYPLCADSDADGTPDYMEVDSDNDGISDAIEAGVDALNPIDTDGDGMPDYQDTDSDNDGVLDSIEGVVQSDSDGIPDYVDADDAGPGPGDSDGDGTDDFTECPNYAVGCNDNDSDGIPDYMDANDEDGPTGDIDGDMIPNNTDPDDDNDGIPDVDEDPNTDGDNDPTTNPTDTDGDGTPDAHDEDSDGDGINDIIEGTGDTDGDGIPDYLDADDGGPGAGDSDGDGIPDDVECPAYPNCPDSDNDGTPDYMETDSDNDGIPDAVEFGALASGNPVDTDGDGVPDFRDSDSDADGVSDATEAGANPPQPVDSDGDGIPDYVDPESSGLQHGGDSDGDGVEDFGECPNYPACPDSDGDNVPDYMDPDSRPYDPNDRIETGLRGVGTNEPILLILLFGTMMIARRFNRKLIVITVAGMSIVTANVANAFQDSWYIGGGMGVTELDPDTGNTGYAVADGSDSGYKLFTGIDIDERFSFEIQQSFLGTATLGNQGNPLLNANAEIDYELPGASAVWYAWHDVPDEQYSYRHGWQAFLLAGLSFIENEANVAHTQANSLQIHVGGGVEYGWDNGLAVRLGIDGYDEDALFTHVSVLFRFGYENNRRQAAVAETLLVDTQQPAVELVETTPTPVVAETLLLPAAQIVSYDKVDTTTADDDADGVINTADQCANTPAGASVDVNGCPVFEFSLKGVNFETNSADITSASTAVLDEAAQALLTNPLVNVEIQAHTDDRGPRQYNLKLSEERAQSVRSYLIDKGVAADRLQANGYGESAPIESNDTAEGRAKNRRVEFRVIE